MTQNNNGEASEKAHPGYRCAARVFDLTLGCIVLFIAYDVILALLGDENLRHTPLIYLTLMFLPISILFDSLCYAVLGGTLGKWLFGVKKEKKTHQ